MSLDNAIDLFTIQSECQISYKDCVYCFGMSKMTVTNENEESKTYYRLLFVEFLEMVGRIAHLKY
jgi:hypothetical protein